MSNKIVVVEDDKDISELIRLHLSDNGYTVEICSHGDFAVDSITRSDCILAILDIMLPGKNGLDICRELRQLSTNVPILMLTSRSEEIDKILGLEVGADDYLTKPFSIRELIARVRALIRRSSSKSYSENKEIIKSGELTIDCNKRLVTRGNKELDLTVKEFDLLEFLARNPGRPFTREELLSRIWDYTTSGYDHTVNTHINRLRAKVEIDIKEPKWILTVWGVGYKFTEN